MHEPNLKHIVSHLRQMGKIMKTGNYDAVHSHTSYHSGLVMAAAWREHIRVRIAHARTSGCRRTGLLVNPAIAFGKTLIWLFSTCRLAVSKEAGEFLFSGHEYEILHDAIDLDRIQSCNNVDISKHKAALKIPEDAFAIGQIARFEWIKNHDFTLHWFQNFSREHENTYLVLLGDGPLNLNFLNFATKKPAHQK